MQGLGDWKAPVCASRKNPQPMKQSEINPSPATTNFLKIPPVWYFCLENSVPRRSIVKNFTISGESGLIKNLCQIHPNENIK